MTSENGKKFFYSLPGLAVVIFLCVSQIGGQRLAIRAFQTGDGLTHNNIKQIFQDAKGFLWIATDEGLSRFDGYDFTNYDLADGLGHIFINDTAADNQGRLWIATNGGGVALLIDQPPENSSRERKKFSSFQIAEGGENNTANAVNRILFDAENRLWCATDDGLYRAANLEVADYNFVRVADGTQPVSNNAALRDHSGRLWFSVSSDSGKNRVIQIAAGKINEYELRETVSAAPLEIHTIIETGDRHILAAGLNGIFEFIEATEEGGRGEWRKLPIALPPLPIQIIAAAPDGGLWIGAGGLIRVRDGRQMLYTIANGLGANVITALFYDREGIFWIGTNGGGLGKLAGEGVVSYTAGQGLPAPDIYRIVEDRGGRIYAQAGGCRLFEITADNRIVALTGANESRNITCLPTFFLQDKRGNWWFRTQQGLKFSSAAELDLRVGKLVTDEKGALFKYTEIYEDAEGVIWLTNDQTGKLYKITGDSPRPTLAAENVPAEFILRDKTSGTVWLANRAKLWRLRRNGEVEEIQRIEGLPVLQPRCLFQDARGRVFVGTRYHGAIVTDEPEADEPRFSRFRSADGLSSDTVWEIAEDNDGRIYFGTGRGIDQFDPGDGKFHHFTTDEGATGAAVFHLLKDSRGNIWAASVNGITRINPRETRRADKNPPPIFISQIRVAGEDLPLAETGATEVPAVELSGDNVAIRFVGLSFQGENALRYEYRLVGVDADWIAAGNQREVNFAKLGAGDYRFQVRAVNAENVASPQPAVFEFRVLRPVYLRWWFLVLTAFLISFFVYLFYRNRLKRLLEIERTRTRIATDLHDDIGSNLTKISIMSEVARRVEGEKQTEMLRSIADISRVSVSSMSDIVWAINPKKDSFLELTRRMRGYAEVTLEQADILLEFNAPEIPADLNLDADVRRNVYLIFKESLNNIVRHSLAEKVKIDFAVLQNKLILTVADDGKGFALNADSDGNGLPNMKRRAENIKADFEIVSTPYEGTKIVLKVPLERWF